VTDRTISGHHARQARGDVRLVQQVRCARLDALHARAVKLDGGGDHGVNIARNRAA